MNDESQYNSQPPFSPQNPQFSGGPNPSDLPFGEKLSLAFSLTKSHALTLFLVLLVGWFVIYAILLVAFGVFGFAPMLMSVAGNMAGGTPNVSGGSIAFMFFGLFVTTVIVGILAQFFMIGVNALTLQYADGERPESIVATVMSPWSRFGSIILCVLMWILISIAFQIASVIVGLIPILGLLIILAASIIFAMAGWCAMFYMADREDVRPVESVALPFKIVTSNFVTWLVAGITTFVAYIPAFIAMFLVITLAAAFNSVFMIFLAGLFGLACFVAVSVFAFFFLALTYRQTRGGFVAATGVFN